VTEDRLNRAGFDCHGGRVVDGVVSCSLTSVVADSGDDTQHEIAWQVQITAGPDRARNSLTDFRGSQGYRSRRNGL
jgi:hypothetical protein